MSTHFDNPNVAESLTKVYGTPRADELAKVYGHLAGFLFDAHALFGDLVELYTSEDTVTLLNEAAPALLRSIPTSFST